MLTCLRRSCLPVLAFLLPASVPAEESRVTLTVDGAPTGQMWEGWGATDGFSFDGLEEEEEAGRPGRIPREARKEIVRLYYQDLGLTRVRFRPLGYEPENDNDDPRVIAWPAFAWAGRGTQPTTGVDPFCMDHLVLGREFRDAPEPFVFHPSARQWEAWMGAKPDGRWWEGEDARFNPAQVEEYAEHAVAAALYIKRAYGYELPAWSLFDEPSQAAQPDADTVLALARAVGRRFREHGLKTGLVIGDDVTPEASAEAVGRVLADEEARAYVRAVSYRGCRGEAALERPRTMLAKARAGEPLVREPAGIAGDAARHGKSVWLVGQGSDGEDGLTLYDAGQARANHICDEINRGRVHAFEFRRCWFVERGKPGNEEAPIFLRFRDGRFERAEVNAFGAWIRHFTRHIRPGAERRESRSDDPRVKAAAFFHAKPRAWTLVVVNNRLAPAALTVRLGGVLGPGGAARRTRTSPGRLAEALADVAVKGDGGGGVLEDEMPGSSVTTYVIEAGR